MLLGSLRDRIQPHIALLPTLELSLTIDDYLNAAIAELAEARGLPICTYSRDKVREAFWQCGTTTKQGLAEIISKHIPAFERYVPPARKPRQSEDARMGIFDAAALTLMFFQDGSDGSL